MLVMKIWFLCFVCVGLQIGDFGMARNLMMSTTCPLRTDPSQSSGWLPSHFSTESTLRPVMSGALGWSSMRSGLWEGSLTNSSPTSRSLITSTASSVTRHLLAAPEPSTLSWLAAGEWDSGLSGKQERNFDCWHTLGRWKRKQAFLQYWC